MEVLDRTRPCPKCFAMADVKYESSVVLEGETVLDVMKRKCLCCGFVWYEWPLDHSFVS
jgi:hypothetical protein